ncbi:sensor histidine kinase [Salinispora tropica]|uniref:histidine kinase n=1 Tax=Salinispora tropica (strain ATCC BAA-916 / DSM 44818 / JCM 13857 / NBRC 105044 / CNB-440) TaxID=369723 RepID=A4X7Q5_SALTO|nr:histidine kinase [Salinispora tropica]ABP54905.1 histidine kinase, dimerisation and phosphoacceptor region [Salinispora tropica CNB-440]
MIRPGKILDRWRSSDAVVRDLPFPLLLVAASLIPALHVPGTQLGDLPTRPLDALAIVVVALECLPLALRRRWPAGCLALVSFGFALDQLLGYHTVAGIALPVALLSAGAHLERHRRTVAVVGSAAYVLLAVALDRLGSTEGLAGFITFYLVLAFAWGIGVWLRLSRAGEAERRRHVAETTRIAERTRIARELHDVVTHHVTAMVVQAEAARYLSSAPERLDQTLAAVSDTGRRAITDLRYLLDLLDPDDGAEPVPSSVGELHALVERIRRTGHPVEFTEEGGPRGTIGKAEMAAYRVVQEALTNALKYAYGIRTVVHVRYEAAEINVEISTDGSRSGTSQLGGSGRGLAGLRERVGLLGGELSAERRSGGGFVVRARIPEESPE